MTDSRVQGTRSLLPRLLVAALLAVVATFLALPYAATGATQRKVSIGDLFQSAPQDYDGRTGVIPPASFQRDIVSEMGASVRWNRYGTPQSLIKYHGYLATGLSGTAADAARTWIRAHRQLFKLSDQGVQNLELLSDNLMSGGTGHAVLFRQRFGSLPAAQDGLLTLGIASGKIAYVSSSVVGDGNAPAAAQLSPVQAWSISAAALGREVPATSISRIHKDLDWTVFSAKGFAQVQRSRLRALPTPGNGVRPAYETIVLDAKGAKATAYTTFVDAVTGKVWYRHNNSQQISMAAAAPSSGFYQGNTGGPGDPCGPNHEFEAPAGTKSIDIVASANLPADDIVLNLIYVPTGVTVGSADTATSPEAVHYAPAVIPPGTYAAQVCQYDVAQEGFGYTGFYATNDTISPTYPYPPKWKYFGANPELDYSDTDTRVTGCWESVVGGNPVADCDLELKNLASRGPWDYDFRANQPTFQTSGNNADTAEAWTSPLTPGPTSFRVVSAQRDYQPEWTNEWYNNKCDPAGFVPGSGQDIQSSIVNLFSGHNRMHDFSYFLGFTETNYNLQDVNFGNTNPGGYPFGREADPELGNVQAGAVDGGFPSYLGRDNANQITLNDGIPGITNQYLFQPIAGAFYSPCVDGDFDASVFAHEYTHAISNRMVGGPDSGLSGYQAGSMGESWSDLVALEYLHAYDLVPTDGENPTAVGPYATGNKETGIRDYAANTTPLNYSDLGFDIPGPEVHADGEIWNAVNWDVRKGLIKKYNRRFPASDVALQKRCADGILPADKCPGNRRWAQIMFDAFLLQQPATTMLDARDAYLAADMMRFAGANQKELWRAFAYRGMGEFATTAGTADSEPIPSFESPEQTDEAVVDFDAIAVDEGNAHVNANVYVGDYEARVTPIADTDPSTPLPSIARFVPGVYHFVFQADGYGMQRSQHRLPSGGATPIIAGMATNWASTSNGATATGDGVNHEALIDDTESTDWAALGRTPTVEDTQVTVQLANTQVIREVRVSAMLRPANAADPNDKASQSRFSALRQFAIQTCLAAGAVDCSNDADYSTIYTSQADAFPAGIPRPLAPDLILRSFPVPKTTASHVRMIVLSNQCTGAPGYQGEQDNDPLNNTDCTEFSVQAERVRAAELQVFSHASRAVVPNDPVVLMTMSGPATAEQGQRVTYAITYKNLGPAPADGAVLTDSLPASLSFVSAAGASYVTTTRTVQWNLGSIPVGASKTVKVTAKVARNASFGQVIVNEAMLTAAKTVATPAVAVTTVIGGLL